MKPTRNSLRAGCGWTHNQMPPTPANGWFVVHRKPKTIRALAKAFMKYRAAKRAEDPSVDTFFNRGESATRFAYFNE